MSKYQLKIKLLSDTTFGRGDGVAGLIDQEVEHDSCGLPFLRGRMLKGLLSEECDNFIALLPDRLQWEKTACKLFGTLGSTLGTTGVVHVGDACLPEDLRQAIAYAIEDKDVPKDRRLNKADVLNSLTTIRRQTAIDSVTGVPDQGSLRSARVIVRELEFTADLIFEVEPTEKMIAMLLIGALALRHLGSGRNRGRGHVKCTLYDENSEEITNNYLNFSNGSQEAA